ncbi:VOC family protein [Pseudonocardia sp. TRM90224]|uniref:VOC family protein n=1 Tax=Pseudonocardia sp. TRM90224 TaxID=2812678 RepID=UPI001E5FF6CD|nr:VOC family protein [Pseudonocardia sp. TRM90224]
MLAGLHSIVLDCRRAAPLARFWATALGWLVREYDSAEVERLAGLGHTPDTDPAVAVDAPDGRLTLFVVEVPEPKSLKNRMHLDIRVRDAAHYQQLLDLGARLHQVLPEWHTMTDPEGNEFCIMNPPS